jgi:hypothetical protein
MSGVQREGIGGRGVRTGVSESDIRISNRTVVDLYKSVAPRTGHKSSNVDGGLNPPAVCEAAGWRRLSVRKCNRRSSKVSEEGGYCDGGVVGEDLGASPSIDLSLAIDVSSLHAYGIEGSREHRLSCLKAGINC